MEENGKSKRSSSPSFRPYQPKSASDKFHRMTKDNPMLSVGLVRKLLANSYRKKNIFFGGGERNARN